MIILSPNDGEILYYFLVNLVDFLLPDDSSILIISYVKINFIMDVVVIDIINNHFQKQLYYPYQSSKIYVQA